MVLGAVALALAGLAAGPARADESEPPAVVLGFRRGHAFHLKVVPVDGAQVEVHAAARFLKMRDAAAQDGVELHVRSGYRDGAEQRWLYRAWRAGMWSRAARPGYSKHQSGRALNLNTQEPAVYDWLAAHAAHFGFRRTVSSEAWHWELGAPRRHALRRSRRHH